MNGIELDRDELRSLLTLLSASNVFGLPKISPASQKDGQAFRAGIEKLRSRGLVKGNAPKQAIPDTTLMRLVSVIADPRVVLVAEHNLRTDESAALHYAGDDEEYVTLEGGAASGYRVGLAKGSTLVARRVLRFLGLEPDMKPKSPDFSVPEEVLEKAKELASTKKVAAAASSLQAAGLTDALAPRVAAALGSLPGGLLLAIRLRGEKPDAGRRAWIVSPKVTSSEATEGWLGHRKSSDDPQVYFTALNAADLAAVIEELVEFLSPAP